MNIQGIIPACITPFVDDQADIDAMQTNISRWLDTGVHGLLIFGSTGEFPYLEPEERRTVLQAARAVIPDDILLLAGCGADSTKRTQRFLMEAAEDGADAALVVTPVFYTRGNSRSQRVYYETLADQSPLPLLLYSVPAITAYDLPIDLILSLAQHPNIVGIKDSSTDLIRIMLQTGANLSEFSVFSGNPNLVLSALSMGAAGSITAFGNIIPEIMVGIWDAFHAGDLARAASLQTIVAQLSEDIRHLGIPALKAILNQRGFVAGEPRAPLLPLLPEPAAGAIAAWNRAMKHAGLSSTI